MRHASHPVLSCSESNEWERGLMKSDDQGWSAMRRVGRKLASAICSDFSMTRLPQRDWRVLALVGKGNNGGDALLAIRELLKMPRKISDVTLIFSSPVSDLKPLARKAYELIAESEALRTLDPAGMEEGDWLALVDSVLHQGPYELCIDGLLGMQFKPPLRGGSGVLIEKVNALRCIGLRVAVDLPSGTGDSSDERPFRADITYATGVFKSPLLKNEACGMIRYLDVGFFEEDRESVCRVITDTVLDPLRAFRPASADKRSYGHLLVLAGSRSMPGALAMSVKAASRSGVGLVTVLAPESIAGRFAASLPEAMWRSWPETPEGGLALEGIWQVQTLASKATALLAGPGMGQERETRTMLQELGRMWEKPVLLDADALQPEIVQAFTAGGNEGVVVTPHDGEFWRLSGRKDSSLEAIAGYAEDRKLVLIKKGSCTRVSRGDLTCVCPTGNAVLARGGSGDLLAGLAAGLMAQRPDDCFVAACQAVYWHGRAADVWAMKNGQHAARTTDLLDFLSPALDSGESWNPHSPVERPTGS
ncbi:NAD(P)H-hydrate dehydratase [Pelagicoccus sp. SDUM812003]|uniref:NAD(P)H-hydrate dehydratase n=1 Tax=Pelagicoccus sp. SDUM812003 TaxID=3041267 RepID=UPI00281045D0|nr:NAD(P)H-hydrate dehydratase [Pelagicoccus sp. SDUM812003]MDQ8204818.1 NAD(P)H-hydrate dehydratase [Pelagicoccus sp. SDUM812003]